MADAPSFFVPTIKTDQQEAAYTELARCCNCAVPSEDQRIYSITFNHDGAESTATVGETLKGTSRRVQRSRGQKIERTLHHHDPATVLAIFPGPPCYRVMTNHGVPDRVGSEWANPFLAGQPTRVQYF